MTVAGPVAPAAEPDHRIPAAIEALGQRLAGVRAQIDRVIFGQDAVVDQTLITLLSGGHALSIGVPGLAKTRPVLPPSAVMLWPVLRSRQRAKVALATARATEDGRTGRSSLATEGGLVETRARCWASDDKRVQCLGSPRVTPGPPVAPGFAGPAIRSTLRSATEDGRARRRA